MIDYALFYAYWIGGVLIVRVALALALAFIVTYRPGKD